MGIERCRSNAKEKWSFKLWNVRGSLIGYSVDSQVKRLLNPHVIRY